GKRRRVRPDDGHSRLLHHAVEAGSPGRAAGMELERDDGRAASARQEPGRTAEPGAEIEDAARGADSGPARQRVDGGQPTVVGLEDIVVSTSDICFIDGREGRLVYRGYDVNDLVEHSSFEEVIFLLWHGGLPSKKELDAHTKALNATANRRLPPGIVSLLKALPKKTTPMEVLRTGISALSAYDPDAADNSKDATARKSLRLTAQMPTLVAAWERIR